MKRKLHLYLELTIFFESLQEEDMIAILNDQDQKTIADNLKKTERFSTKRCSFFLY